MAKYIDSDFFRGVLNRMVENLEAVDATRDAETIKSVIRFLKVMEEFHAVDVVRCKECEHWKNSWSSPEIKEAHGYCHLEDADNVIVGRWESDFCSYGERRSDG